MESLYTKSFLTDYQRRELNDYSFNQCSEAIELLQLRIRQLNNADYQSYMEKHIKDLELFQRAYTVLIQARLTTVGEIMNFGLDNIWQLRGCGSFTYKEIKEAVLNDMPNK